MGPPHGPNWYQQRCYGFSPAAPVLPLRDRVSTILQPQLGHAIHHRHVQHGPALPIRGLEGVHQLDQIGRGAREGLDAG
jgi:hypothetical protein